MKTGILKSMVIALSMILWIVFTSSVNPAFGQSCPVKVPNSATGEGCTKKKAIADLEVNIDLVGLTICRQYTCSPQPPLCNLQGVTLLGKRPVCTKVDDTTCLNGRTKWVCTRDVEYDCQCFDLESSKTDETNSPPPADLKNLPASGRLEMFPNPASQQLSFKVSGYRGSVKLLVVNMLGQVVITKTIELNGQELYAVDISSLAPGIYKASLSNQATLKIGTFNKE